MLVLVRRIAAMLFEAEPLRAGFRVALGEAIARRFVGCEKRRLEFRDRRFLQTGGFLARRVEALIGLGQRLFLIGLADFVVRAFLALGLAKHIERRFLGETIGEAFMREGRHRFGDAFLDMAILELVLGGLRRAVVFERGAPVGDRNAVIVGMNLAEGEEAVPIAAIFDEGGLKRRFYTRDLGEIDIAFDLFFSGGLEVEFFEAMTAENDDPGLFRVRRVDEHALCHAGKLQGPRRRPREERAALS